MKFPLVQALRGIAALWVVLFHLSAAGHSTFWLFRIGNNGVAIFFALSGFVIAHSIRDQQITFGFIGRFALRRSIRLDPAYWASIGLFIAFMAASALAKHQPLALPAKGQLLANLTYTQLFAGYPSINDVYWTLCYEVQFYLVLVLCVMAGQKYRLAYFVPFAVALLFGTGLVKNPVPGLFLDLWHCFFLGALAYWAITNRAAFGAFLLLGGALLVSIPSLFTLVCLATAAGLLIAGRSGFIERPVSRPLMFLGAISYSLYLVHNPVSGAATFLMRGLPQPLVMIVAVIASIAAAWLFWLVIERPTQRLSVRVVNGAGNRRVDRKREVPVFAGVVGVER